MKKIHSCSQGTRTQSRANGVSSNAWSEAAFAHGPGRRSRKRGRRAQMQTRRSPQTRSAGGRCGPTDALQDHELVNRSARRDDDREALPTRGSKAANQRTPNRTPRGARARARTEREGRDGVDGAEARHDVKLARLVRNQRRELAVRKGLAGIDKFKTSTQPR